MIKSENFIFRNKDEYVRVTEGMTRQVLGYDDQMMLVKVDFEAGGIAPVHQHEQRQCTYVVSGLFEFQIGEESRTVKAGDGLYMEPHILHGVKCIEEGTLIDTFSPIREDFLK